MHRRALADAAESSGSIVQRENAAIALPVQPKAMPALVVTVSRESMPDAWRDYLYWTGELEHD